MVDGDNKNLTRMGIDKILQFLPVLKGKDFNIGQWHCEKNVFPYFSYSDDILKLEKVLYDEGFILCGFDWQNWNDGVKLMQNPELIKNADLLTLRKLITANVRQDRFCEGHLACCFKDGTIVKILERLKELSDKFETMN